MTTIRSAQEKPYEARREKCITICLSQAIPRRYRFFQSRIGSGSVSEDFEHIAIEGESGDLNVADMLDCKGHSSKDTVRFAAQDSLLYSINTCLLVADGREDRTFPEWH